MGGSIDGNPSQYNHIEFSQLNFSQVQNQIAAELEQKIELTEPYSFPEFELPEKVQNALNKAKISLLAEDEQITLDNVLVIKQNGELFYSTQQSGVFYSEKKDLKTRVMNSQGRLVQLSSDSIHNLNSKSMNKANIYTSNDGKTVFSFIDGKLQEIQANSEGVYTVSQAQEFVSSNNNLTILEDQEKQYLIAPDGQILQLTSEEDGSLSIGKRFPNYDPLSPNNISQHVTANGTKIYTNSLGEVLGIKIPSKVAAKTNLAQILNDIYPKTKFPNQRTSLGKF